jgi:4-hydroxy-tetrahydrodipicolinate synthase
VAALCAAFLDGRWAEAQAIHRELFNFGKAMFLETNPIPVKGAMKMLGRDTGALRLPMCAASEATLASVRQALTAQGLL